MYSGDSLVYIRPEEIKGRGGDKAHAHELNVLSRRFPAFALMLNAVTGYGDEFRENGRALKATQGLWVSESYDDYLEKYTLSVSAAMNAYNFEDLSKIIKIYNKDASVSELIALAEACSYNAVLARRGQ